MAAEPCEVWWARPEAAGEHLLAHLSEEERARHERLRRPADRDRFLASHALLRVLLGRRLGIVPSAVDLNAAEGKPRLADPDAAYEFSLSHSGGWVVVAI